MEAETESDVEQKIVYPLLCATDFLGIDSSNVKTKGYLAPSQLDKQAGKKSGYYPDYSVWICGYPLLIVEVKAPSIDANVGYREACLYARHLNSSYPHGLNPCSVVLATNGNELLAGYWDAEPVLRLVVDDIRPGSVALNELRAICGESKLQTDFELIRQNLVIGRAYRPYSFIGGQALLNAKRPLNSFAADLSPILRRFFSSSAQSDVREIAKYAYVSSTETTDYDRVLESLLKDRVSARRDTIVQALRTTKGDEPQLTQAIKAFDNERPPSGQLQIVQGGVGAGKSLFIRRYREVLQPPELQERSVWAFVDFNEGPPNLKGAENWLCEQFISSFEKENSDIDLYSENTLRGIFSHKIQSRKGIYAALKTVSDADSNKQRALDLAAWQSDVLTFTEGLGSYIGGVKRSNLIVVMDNVDRLDLSSQLDAFQLALWFMGKTRAFVILQMRDETYERHKNKPPLDTFRAGIAFHISPPRFIDVVKRRLELGIEYLAANSPDTQEYYLENGYRMIVPTSSLGTFLYQLYREIFINRRNIARVLEALSGSDVRRALEMFSSIVTSGHITSDVITSNVLGDREFPLAEYHIIRILMRTDYRFFSERSGYIHNIFHFEESWDRADNFLLCEILYYLSLNRKRQGPLGLEGYFGVASVCDEVERLGYPRETVLHGINYLLRKQLIGADDFNYTEVTEDECIKIQASGFIHLRVLSERLEYLYGVLPVTPITEKKVAEDLGDIIQRESQRNFATPRETAIAVAKFEEYLRYEAARLRERNPFFGGNQSGVGYVLTSISGALRRYSDRGRPSGQNELDFA
ncbi:hypothetical protein [Candidatus Phycosocius bacilliformis]|uniref:hypothetical protein n=1 Tax=Candidatus Phycosocius bacilliformis TaxID=1445552 RepID=UPI001057D107|nr:hypothetical protein [Candidatus Phycosocius bacilliformis]